MKLAFLVATITVGFAAGCKPLRPAGYFNLLRGWDRAERSDVEQEREPIMPHSPTLIPTPARRPSQQSIAKQAENLFVESGDKNRLAAFADELHTLAEDPPEPESLPARDGGAISGVPPLSQFEEMALANNPTLAAAQAQVEAAQGNWVQVGLPPNPRIGYVGDEMGDEGTLGRQGGYVGRTYVRGGKLELNQMIASQQITQAEQELAAQQFRVLSDVRLAYYDFLIAVRRSDLAETLIGYARDVRNDTKRLLDGGEAKRSDLLRAQIEERSIGILIQNAENQQQVAWKNLTAVTGSVELEMPSIDRTFKTFAKHQLDAAVERGIDRQSELARILESSPELAAAAANVEAARWTVNRAHAEPIPDIDARLAVLGDNATGHLLVGVQLELPIPVWNQNQGAIQRAHANVIAAERTADGIALNLQRRFAVAYQQYLNAKYQVDQYIRSGETDREKGILDKVNESIEANKSLHLAGEINNLEMITAQRVYTQANLSYLDAIRNLWAAILQIDGLLLKDSFQ